MTWGSSRTGQGDATLLAGIGLALLVVVGLIRAGIVASSQVEQRNARSEQVECLALLSYMQTPSDSLRFLITVKRCTKWVGSDSLERMVAQ